MLWDRRQFLVAGGAFAALGRAEARRSQPFRWTPASPMPVAVQEIYPAAFDGRIYVAGGLAIRSEHPVAGRVGPTAGVHFYDPKTEAWSVGPGLDKPRHHPNLVAAQGSLWSVGGFHTSSRGGWTCNGDVLRLDRGAKVWEPAAAMPRPRGETVVGVLDGRVHVIAGRAPKGSANGAWGDHADVADHDVFDPAKGRWESLRPAPTARNSHAGAVIDGALYVVGGRTVGGGNLAVSERYDPKADRWDRLAPMPKAQGGGVYPDVWIYDPTTDRWASGPPMPTPRHGLGAVALDDRIYVIGGATRAGGDGTSAVVETFRPA